MAEAFLSIHLDGRYEPIGAAFSDSSIDIEAGAELVPGLAQSLHSVAP